MSHFFVPILYRKYIMAIMTALVKKINTKNNNKTLRDIFLSAN